MYIDKTYYKIKESPLIEIAENDKTNQKGIVLKDIFTDFGRVLLVYIPDGKRIVDFDNVHSWMIRDIGIIKTIPREEFNEF